MVISEIYNTILYIPILNSLVFFYHLLFSNFGLAIIAITVVIRIITYPLSKPMMELSKKQKEIQPELDRLKQKYKNKQVFAQKQMALYKEKGINPAAGCLPQIIQLIVIIALYRVFTNLLSTNGVMISEINSLLYNFDFLKFAEGAELNTKFLYLNLSNPDQFFILPVLAAVAQYLMSRFTMKTSTKLEKIAKDTPDKTDDVMYNMQNQMVYLMPIMTLVIGYRLPSGLVLYWFVSTLLIVLQYFVSNKRTQKASS